MLYRVRATISAIIFSAIFFSGALGEVALAADYKETGKNKAAVKFHSALANAAARRKLPNKALCDQTDAVESRILSDYGAIFVAADSVAPPPVCVFNSSVEVAKFQKQLKTDAGQISGAAIELQVAAMKALLNARDEAVAENLDITPRAGSEAGRRSYEDTLRLWNSRFFPALKYWQTRGSLTIEDADAIFKLPVRQQVAKVLEWEAQGLFFSSNFSKSILYSVAAPGTSQHLAMLAFDVNEHGDARVREILARHGWFRTVRNDAPHFTYLGLAEEDLPAHGLQKITAYNGDFWIPNI